MSGFFSRLRSPPDRCAAGRPKSCSWGPPVVQADRSNPWSIPRHPSYGSIMATTAPFWSTNRLALAAALGVVAQRAVPFVVQPEVIDQHPIPLLLEYPVHPCDGLHQPVAPHGLVGAHRVRAGA